MTMTGAGSAPRRRLGATTATLIVLGVAACENPQPPASCGPVPQVTVNAGERASVIACFNDPNGDTLAYSVSSTDPGVAAASISGTAVRVDGVAPGNASVTITASDPGGLQAEQEFQVMVPNRPPVPRGTIPSITVHVGQAASVDVSPYFTEPDGGALTYGATSSSPAVATVSVSGSTITITAVGKGTANVTITATDPEGLSATQAFASVVPNRSPETVGTIPDETVEVGEPVTVDLSPYFADPDGDRLTYGARSSRANIARVSVSGSTVTVTAVAKGTTNVTITATDTDGLSATQAFASVVPNRAPEPVGSIPDETVEVGEPLTVDLSPYFADPDDDRLTYTAESSNTSVAGVSVSGPTVRITAVGKGTATVTITATDTEGLSATQAFASMVPNRAPRPVATIPDETVQVGGAVAVDVSSYFADPDGDPLAYTARSSNTNVAEVSVSGSTVTIAAVGKGTAAVTITATDTEGLSAAQVFVSVVPNRSPEPVGTIPDDTVEVGEPVTVDLSPYFADPDGDALAYAASSSNTEVARVSVSGSSVTLTAIARGTAIVTTTATDAEGLSATQVFAASVPNRSPAPVGRIPGAALDVGEPITFDLSPHFTDPDGDPLTYTATSSNANVATVSVSGSIVTIRAVAAGSATITITARDPGGLTATQRAGVTVRQPNRAPRPSGTIPTQTLNPGGTVAISAPQYFTDPDGDPLTYTATSSNPNVASVSVSGSTVTIRAVAAGSATITITARDPGGLTATQRVGVTVRQPNRAPRPSGTIPTQTLNPGGTVAISASQYFSDPDGDPLTYTAASSNPSVASVTVSGSTVTIRAVAAGSATITIIARDPGGRTANQTFRVNVGDRGSFDIDLVFATDVTSAQEQAFRDAAERWMAILADTELADHEVDGTIDCGGQYPQTVGTIDDLMIVAAVVEIDGPGGILGRAGPCWVRNADGLPLFGRMEFDDADLDRQERQGRLKALILHEMGHVLGIGTLWGHHNLLRNPSSQTDSQDTHFVGPSAVAAFDAAGGAGYTGGAKVPVENTGGAGTRNSHWRASVFGNELMIGYLTDSSPLSAITIQSLADLGYTVDPSLADGYGLPGAAAAAAMLGDGIHLGHDVLQGPIVVVDRNGRIVRVIRPD